MIDGYEPNHCNICKCLISIYGSTGALMPPWQYKRRKACNAIDCQTDLRHNRPREVEVKKCIADGCSNDVPIIWPRGAKKTIKQYDKVKFCSQDCHFESMFNNERPRPIPILDSVMDNFIYGKM